MIYLTDKITYIDIPKHTESDSDVYTLELKNGINNEVFKLSDLKNNDLNKLFYRFYGVDFSGLVTGEYVYKLYDVKNNELESGIAIAGDYKGTDIQYHKENKNIQYEG